MTYARPTDPSSVIGVVADSFRLHRASIRSLYVPVFLLALIVGAVAPGWIPIPYPEGVGLEMDYGVGFWLRSIASHVANVYMYGVIIAGVHFAASGDSSGIRSSLDIAMRQLPTILAVSLLYRLVSIGLLWVVKDFESPLAIFAGMLPLVVSAVFLATVFFASFVLPITEGYGPINSLRESYSLVRRRWWRTFAVLAIMTAMEIVMSFASGKITLFLAGLFIRNLVVNTVSTLTHAAFQAIILSWSVCLLYGAYQDLRLRQQPVTP